MQEAHEASHGSGAGAGSGTGDGDGGNQLPMQAQSTPQVVHCALVLPLSQQDRHRATAGPAQELLVLLTVGLPVGADVGGGTKHEQSTPHAAHSCLVLPSPAETHCEQLRARAVLQPSVGERVGTAVGASAGG